MSNSENSPLSRDDAQALYKALKAYINKESDYSDAWQIIQKIYLQGQPNTCQVHQNNNPDHPSDSIEKAADNSEEPAGATAEIHEGNATATEKPVQENIQTATVEPAQENIQTAPAGFDQPQQSSIQSDTIKTTAFTTVHHSAPQTRDTFEFFTGRLISGVFATILLVIGFIFAAKALNFSFGYTSRLVSMFLFSAGFIFAGHKTANHPRLGAILSGCGFSLLYVSFYVGCFTFNLLPDTLWLGFVVLWAILIATSSRRGHHILSALAQFGIILSLPIEVSVLEMDPNLAMVVALTAQLPLHWVAFKYQSTTTLYNLGALLLLLLQYLLLCSPSISALLICLLCTAVVMEGLWLQDRLKGRVQQIALTMLAICNNLLLLTVVQMILLGSNSGIVPSAFQNFLLTFLASWHLDSTAVQFSEVSKTIVAAVIGIYYILLTVLEDRSARISENFKAPWDLAHLISSATLALMMLMDTDIWHFGFDGSQTNHLPESFFIIALVVAAVGHAILSWRKENSYHPRAVLVLACGSATVLLLPHLGNLGLHNPGLLLLTALLCAIGLRSTGTSGQCNVKPLILGIILAALSLVIFAASLGRSFYNLATTSYNGIILSLVVLILCFIVYRKKRFDLTVPVVAGAIWLWMCVQTLAPHWYLAGINLSLLLGVGLVYSAVVVVEDQMQPAANDQPEDFKNQFINLLKSHGLCVAALSLIVLIQGQICEFIANCFNLFLNPVDKNYFFASAQWFNGLPLLQLGLLLAVIHAIKAWFTQSNRDFHVKAFISIGTLISATGLLGQIMTANLATPFTWIVSMALAVALCSIFSPKFSSLATIVALLLSLLILNIALSWQGVLAKFSSQEIFVVLLLATGALLLRRTLQLNTQTFLPLLWSLGLYALSGLAQGRIPPFLLAGAVMAALPLLLWISARICAAPDPEGASPRPYFFYKIPALLAGSCIYIYQGNYLYCVENQLSLFPQTPQMLQGLTWIIFTLLLLVIFFRDLKYDLRSYQRPRVVLCYTLALVAVSCLIICGFYDSLQHRAYMLYPLAFLVFYLGVRHQLKLLQTLGIILFILPCLIIYLFYYATYPLPAQAAYTFVVYLIAALLTWHLGRTSNPVIYSILMLLLYWIFIPVYCDLNVLMLGLWPVVIHLILSFARGFDRWQFNTSHIVMGFLTLAIYRDLDTFIPGIALVVGLAGAMLFAFTCEGGIVYSICHSLARSLFKQDSPENIRTIYFIPLLAVTTLQCIIQMVLSTTATKLPVFELSDYLVLLITLILSIITRVKLGRINANLNALVIFGSVATLSMLLLSHFGNAEKIGIVMMIMVASAMLVLNHYKWFNDKIVSIKASDPEFSHRMVIYLLNINWILGASFYICKSHADLIWQLALLVCCCVFYGLTVKQMLQSNSYRLIKNIYLEVKLFLLIALFNFQILHFGQTSYSLLSLIAALVILITGFKMGDRQLRQMGLIPACLFTLKLIFADIQYNSELAQALSYLAGGLILMVVCIIYNKMTGKKDEKTQSTVNTRIS